MSLLTPGRNIVLVGMMGSGKSTVGRLVAQRLGRTFVDTDELVAREAGVAVTELFATAGERRFRELEAEAVRAVAALRGQVVAVGGGAVVDPANVTQLRATGDIVFLDADVEVLAERVGDAASRPLLAGETPVGQRLQELRDARLAAYRSAAAHIVDTSELSAEETVEHIVTWARTQPGLLSRDERP